MADYKNKTEAEIEKLIRGFELNITRFKDKPTIVKTAEKEIEALKAELDSRSGKAESEKKAKEATKKASESKEDKKETKKESTSKKAAPKKTEKKEEAKKEDKKPTAAKKKRKSASAEEFELKIDGKVYKFKDLNSKEECERAIAAVQARREEQIEHQEAREAGKKAARTIPVTRRVSDGLVSVTKKAISEAKKQDKPVAELKKDIDAVEKAFSKLFDTLERLMGKKIPVTQRKAVMDILGNFEKKAVDESTKDTKKSAAKAKKKEDGGLADSGAAASTDDSSNGWSYLELM